MSNKAYCFQSLKYEFGDATEELKDLSVSSNNEDVELYRKMVGCGIRHFGNERDRDILIDKYEVV